MRPGPFHEWHATCFLGLVGKFYNVAPGVQMAQNFPPIGPLPGKIWAPCPAWVFYRCPSSSLSEKHCQWRVTICSLALSMSGMLLGSLVWWANFTMSRQGCKWPKISPQLAHYQGKFARRCPAWVFYRCPSSSLSEKHCQWRVTILRPGPFHEWHATWFLGLVGKFYNVAPGVQMAQNFPPIGPLPGKIWAPVPSLGLLPLPKLLLERKTLPVEGYNFAPWPFP